MAFMPRLYRNLALVMAVPALLAWYVASQDFPLTATQSAFVRAALPVALLVLDALTFFVLARLVSPLRSALSRSAPLDRGQGSAAVLSGFRVPGRLAATILVLSALGTAALLPIAMGLGVAFEVAAAGAAVGLACGILAAMLAYSVAATSLAPAVEALGLHWELREKGTVRGKILALGYGLLTIAMLLFAATGYVRYRADTDAEYLAAITRAQEAAAAQGRAGAALAEFVYAASGAPSEVLGPGGHVVARFGPTGSFQDGLAASAPPLERIAGGWLLRRPAGFGATLVTYAPEAPLGLRRDGFWSSLLVTCVGVYAAASLLVWLAASTITVPIRPLGEAADRIASGDLTASPASLSRDEMGQLAAEFRRMVQGLKALVGEVQAASRGVSEGAREMVEIGERVRAGALAQHDGSVVVNGAVEAMQSSVSLVGKGVEGLSEYVASTSAAVTEMAAALDEVRRLGGELDRAMAAAMGDVQGLADAGHRAEATLEQLEGLAGHAGGTLKAVSASLSGLEKAAIASQLTAAQAAELADHAGGVVGETVQGIESLRTAVGDAQARVTALGRRAGDIDQIVDFIAEVAGRTNLLSLNASIIAAQAGEHGKAFAVVADQIRELASQIARSTQSIGNIIRAVREDVVGTATLIDRGDALAASGVELARKSVGALQQIRLATAQGHETAAAIRAAVQAHAQSSGEVSRLVGSVTDGSKAVAQAVQLVGTSVAAVGSVSLSVRTVIDQVTRALAEQSSLGRRQLESLERINHMIADVTRAVGDHDGATRRVRSSLDHLGSAAELHEEAVEELAGVAGRLGGRARALADRVGRFKV